jgi:hypothetical protein
MNENQKKHLEHPFYKEANDFREEVRTGQILKGAEKYERPFSGTLYTSKQLLVHAMQENVDQGHYIYGLYELIESEKKKLNAVLEDVMNELTLLEMNAKEQKQALVFYKVQSIKAKLSELSDEV